MIRLLCDQSSCYGLGGNTPQIKGGKESKTTCPFLKANSKTLFYTETSHQGVPPKTTTLLLHGLGSSSCFYIPILPSLTSKSRCIALDYPGSGLSKIGSTEQSIPSLALDAIALLDGLGIKEKVVVVGHSMGGILASYLASEFKERVKAAVLLGPVNPGPGLAPMFEQRIKVVKSEGLETLANTIPTGATAATSTLLQQAFIRSLIIGTPNEGYISLCNVIAKATKPDYGKIDVPLLILAGKEDKTAALPACEAILKDYGTKEEQKRLKVIEECGHWHCVEKGAEIGEEISNFLAGLP